MLLKYGVRVYIEHRKLDIFDNLDMRPNWYEVNVVTVKLISYLQWKYIIQVDIMKSNNHLKRASKFVYIYGHNKKDGPKIH